MAAPENQHHLSLHHLSLPPRSQPVSWLQMITCHLVIPKFISVHGRDPCTPDVRYPSLLFLSKPAPPSVFPAAAPTFRCLGHKSRGCLWFLPSSDTPGMICQHILQRLLPGTYAEPHPFSPGPLSRGTGPVACLPGNLCVFISGLSFHLFAPSVCSPPGPQCGVTLLSWT